MKNLKRGFTLIEMLIVVVIIGILAAALIPRLQSVQGRARDTKRKADLQQIGSASAIYKTDKGSYSGLTITNLAPNYLTAVPSDPTGLPAAGAEFGATSASGGVVGGYGFRLFCNESTCLLLGAKTEVAGSSNAVAVGSTPATLSTLNGTAVISAGTALQTGNVDTAAATDLRYYYVQ